MDPTFVSESAAIVHPPRPGPKQLLRAIGRFGALLGRVLFYRPLASACGWNAKAGVDRGTKVNQFCRALLYRLMFVPVLMALTVAALVYAGTHPKQPGSEVDPSSLGVYYDPVTFLSEDGVRLEAWLVPVLEPGAVIAQKEQVLRQKYPAVVLVHDFGNRRQQMLPLVRPLHDAGNVVLVVSLRGCSPSGASGATFGLRESLDVRAAVQTVRNLVYVDPKRIAIVGVGTGASAALLAVADDPRVTALVLEHPTVGAQQLVTDHLTPRVAALNWLSPMCKWAFEMSYQVDADDLEWSRLGRVLKSRSVLMLDSPSSASGFSDEKINSVREFLREKLKTRPH
jgi:pimeloyl-ACP methyl ester carboxylesterase